jgi:hypothetical protein
MAKDVAGLLAILQHLFFAHKTACRAGLYLFLPFLLQDVAGLFRLFLCQFLDLNILRFILQHPATNSLKSS